MSKTHGHARKRIVHIYELCKGKKICEGGDEIDQKDGLGEGNGDEETKKVLKIFYPCRKYIPMALKSQLGVSYSVYKWNQ